MRNDTLTRELATAISKQIYESGVLTNTIAKAIQLYLGDKHIFELADDDVRTTLETMFGKVPEHMTDGDIKQLREYVAVAHDGDILFEEDIDSAYDTLFSDRDTEL